MALLIERPEDPEIYVKLGVMRTALKQFDAAKSDLDKAIALYNKPRVYSALGLIEGQDTPN